MLNTLFISVGSTAIAMVGGITLAWITVRTHTPLVDKFQWVLVVPFFLSPLLGAIAWQGLAGKNIGLLNGLLETLIGVRPLNIVSSWGIFFVMGIYYSPVAYLFVAGTLSNMDSSLEEVARISGASRFDTLRNITLPLMAPSLISSGILVFVLSASQFSVPAIYGLRNGFFVLSTRIWQSFNLIPIDYGDATAAAIALTVFTALLIILRLTYVQKREYTTILGKATRPRKMHLGKWKWVTLGIVLAYILFAVILPFGYFIMMSFYQYMVPVPTLEILTLSQWETVLFDYPSTKLAIRNSLMLGIGGALIAITLGLMVSWIVVRTDVRLKKTVDSLGTIPIAVPSIVMGAAMLWAVLSLPFGLGSVLYGSIYILGIAYVARFFPYAVRSIDSNLRQVSGEMEEVAYTTGASWLRTARSVTLPLLKPGIVAAFVLLYTLFVRELAMSILLYSSESVVLSVMIFDLWFDGNIAQVAVVGTIQLGLIMGGLLVFVKVFDVDLVEVASR
jgi:iron(III) transport system permease protein